ncbi:hypothetical protein [Candidatus Alkanophaga liquidiphilum]
MWTYRSRRLSPNRSLLPLKRRVAHHRCECWLCPHTIERDEHYVLVRLPYHVSARLHEECFEELKKLALPLLENFRHRKQA